MLRRMSFSQGAAIPPSGPPCTIPRFPSTMPAARFRLRPDYRFKETHS
jgi:hypothetical protein